MAASLGYDLANPPGGLPSYMNSLDFASMGLDLQKGWTLASLIMTEVMSYTDRSRTTEIAEAAKTFYDTIAGLSWSQQL